MTVVCEADETTPYAVAPLLLVELGPTQFADVLTIEVVDASPVMLVSAQRRLLASTARRVFGNDKEGQMKTKNFFLSGLVLRLWLISVSLTMSATSQAITINVPAGGDLQTAINNAAPGDTVALVAGATYSGTFVLPKKPDGSYAGKSESDQYITITSAEASSLKENARVSPSDVAHLAKIAVVANGQPALKTEAAAHHYRLIALEVTAATSQTVSYGIIYLGDGGSTQNSLALVPHDFILSQLYVHGHSTLNASRGIELQSAKTNVLNSYISEIHGEGFDTQAICGWNGPGPYKIINNYLEAAGENVMFGGADPSIADLVPSDIEIKRNHFSKPLSWRIGDSSYAGAPWTVKNLLELKNAQRVVIDGNLLENCWAHAQTGYAVLFTPRNQGGTAPWSVVQDVQFSNNIVRHTAHGMNVSGRDSPNTSQQTKRVTIRNNLFYDIDTDRWAGGDCCQGLWMILSGIDQIAFDHNTGFHNDAIVTLDGQPPTTNFSYTNNITPHSSYGISGSGQGSGTVALDYFTPGAVFLKNVLAGGQASSYPANNFFPPNLVAVGFVDQAADNYRLAETSPYKSAGTDGKDLGADIDAIIAAQGDTVADRTPPTAPQGLRVAGAN